MSKINFYKQVVCLLSLLAMNSISTFNLSAKTITSFLPQDFWVVDHTTNQYTTRNGINYNPNGVIGYQVIAHNAYQLTDTIPFMTVAMWDKNNKIDLNQDFEMYFKVWLGAVKPYQSEPPNISDGICFVMHTKDSTITQNLIGSPEMYIGYGHTAGSPISPSFAIEWDSEYNGVNQEGYTQSTPDQNCHISYLKYANMSALQNIAVPSQNNWGRIARNDWFRCKIHWKKSVIDGVPVWDMLTYMQEKDTSDPNYNSLLLRHSMRFYSLSEVIFGLELDSNCQALVNWGVTSATCIASNPGRQRVWFDSLIIGDMPPRDSIIVNLRWETPGNPCPRDTFINIGTYAGDCYTLPKDKWKQNNTIIISDCILANVTSPYLEFRGIDVLEAEWYINDSLVIPQTFYCNDSVCRFYFYAHRDLYKNSDTVIVKAVLDGEEYVFIFNNGEKPLNNYFVENKDNFGFDAHWVMEIDNPSVEIIALPEGLSDSCVTITYNDESDFASLPHIVNGKLSFELASVSCDGVTITLQDTCVVCGEDKIDLTFKGVCDSCEGVGFYFEPLPPQKQRLLVDYYGGNILVRTTNGKSIVQADLTRPNGTLFTTYGNGTGSLDVSVSMPCTCDTTTASFPICATLEGGLICCDTVYVTYICCDKVYKHIDTIPTCADYDYGTKRVNITAALLQFPVPAEPLRISICSQSGDEVMLVSNSIPTELVSYFNPSVANLTAGMYYVVFQIAGETYAIQFFKQ